MSLLLSIIYLFNILCESKLDHLIHPRFYNIQWIATLPPTVEIAADTFAVTEVSLTTQNKELNHKPTITGLKNPNVILNNSTDNTIAISHTVSVTWDFNNTLTHVDYVRIVTNCGATKASLFCNNSNLILTNESTTYILPTTLTGNMINKDLHPFANGNDCEHNILILDKKLQASEPECGFECEQCLQYLQIDLTTYTMNTSYENGDIYVYPPQHNDTDCDCPSYTLNLKDNDELHVFNQANEYSGLLASTASTERIQMTWTQWMGNEIPMCRQSYLPNTDSFMTAPSWRNITFTYHIRRDTDIIEDDTQPTYQQLDNFEINIQEFLDDIFNSTWVNSVTFTQQSTYYVLNITSHDQEMSLNVIEIIQIFGESEHNIKIGIINITAKSFDVQHNEIIIIPQTRDKIPPDTTEHDYIWLPHLADNDNCDIYFQTTTPAPKQDEPNKRMILIITFIIVAVVLLIIFFILWRNKMACFKQKPEESTAIKGYPKTNSEQMRNKGAVLFKQQTQYMPRGLKTNESQRLNISAESDDEKGIYYGAPTSSQKYRKVSQSGAISSDENGTESKIELALDSARNRVYEFKDFGKELRLDSMIGKGSFAKVWKAKWEAENVAVKIFNSVNENSGDAVLTEKEYKEIYAEIYLATSIPPHPNIIRINGFCRKPLCVVMEYMAGGSVQKLVYGQTNKPIPSVIEKLIILVKACFGLAKLTEYKLHHRDIAARNILLGKYDAKIDSDTPVKITDFGMTRLDGGMDDDNKTKNNTGPCKWMAPESIKQKIYNEKTDVYMFGITIWEIMYGREPYEDMDALNAAMNVCMKNERPEFLWNLPLGMKTLIKHCWDKDTNVRPIFKEVARKLEAIQNRVESDIEEIHEMDRAVEEYQRKMNLKKAPSMVVVQSELNLNEL